MMNLENLKETLENAIFVRKTMDTSKENRHNVELQSGYIAGLKIVLDGDVNESNIAEQIEKAVKMKRQTEQATKQNDYWLQGYLVGLETANK